MSSPGGAPTGKPVQLRRVLGLFDLIIIGIVIIQPIAPMGIYGVISNDARGHVVTTILIAMVAMLFTAISYGKHGPRLSQRRLGLHLRRPGIETRAWLRHRLGHGHGLPSQPAHLHHHLQPAHRKTFFRSSHIGRW